MTPDLALLNAHADAVDTLFEDNASRLNALIEAQGTIVHYDRSPMREMTLQSLAKSIVRMEQAQACIPTYARSLRLYIAEIERKQG